MKKTTMLLLWLGAAISISEIFTGGLLAPLGMAKGFAAILIGHLIGGAMLAMGGYIAYARKENAMAGALFSFGGQGGKLIALCNVVQLAGWTIVMIVQACSAVTGVLRVSFTATALILSALVLLWALIFGSPAQRLNDVFVLLLSALCFALFLRAAGGLTVGAHPDAGAGIGVIGAVELSIAMPISWLPLIGDYSSTADDKLCAVGMPSLGYFAGSVLMYLFGLFIGVATGGDVFTFIAQSPFRYLACGVVALSTLTTAFLDLYSAAESSRQIVRTGGRVPILVIGVFAALVSVLFPAERYGDFLSGFLTTISMVFVPVYTVIFLDFILGKRACQRAFHGPKLLLAAAGMAAYNALTRYEIGSPTLLCILLVGLLYGIGLAIGERRRI